MGNRANIKVHDGGHEFVHLYTHWHRDSLPEALRAALRKAEQDHRLQDAQYLTRIIFDEMTALGCSDTTGFGITHYVQDGDDHIIIVNVPSQSVRHKVCGRESVAWSFSEYMNSDIDWCGSDATDEG